MDNLGEKIKELIESENSIQLTKDELEFLMSLQGLSTKIDTLEALKAPQTEIDKAKIELEATFKKADLNLLWENINFLNLLYKP